MKYGDRQAATIGLISLEAGMVRVHLVFRLRKRAPAERKLHEAHPTYLAVALSS
jgi:hypothetical protein